jgi:hypothetical protein
MNEQEMIHKFIDALAEKLKGDRPASSSITDTIREVQRELMAEEVGKIMQGKKRE